jgi:hypothetical protein
MVRHLVLAFTVVAVMAGLLIGGPVVTMGDLQSGMGTAVAQTGAPDYCGPYQTSWYVSSGSYWYAWVWRWCHSPSIEGGWYVDWVNWYWGSYAGPGYSPGYQYSVPYTTQ